MPCLRPIPSTIDDDGLVTLRHSRLEAQLEDGEYCELSCKTCLACRAKRARSWAIRCHHESITSTRLSNSVPIPNGAFITLTYAPEHEPADGSINVEHFQQFMKKLRHKTSNKISYLHCGEYGSKTQRPHYHAILFGIDFHEDRYEWSRQGSKIQWRSKVLEETWGMGHCTLSPVNFATAAYTAGYTAKKLKLAQFIEEHGRIVIRDKKIVVESKKPEYITMSRRPGLGVKWFERYYHDIYPRDLVFVNGREYRPPSFYDDLLKLHDPCLYDQVIEQRQAWLAKQGATSDLQLSARNSIFKAKAKTNNQRNAI